MKKCQQVLSDRKLYDSAVLPDSTEESGLRLCDGFAANEAL